MDTLDSLLTGIIIGVGISIGSIVVMIMAVQIIDRHSKHAASKILTNSTLRNCIVVSQELKEVLQYLEDKIKKLRTELWSEDFVLPYLTASTEYFPDGKNCLIRIDGKEVLYGEITHAFSDTKKADFIIWRIRRFVKEVEIGGKENAE